jgi:hypothetical protein
MSVKLPYGAQKTKKKKKFKTFKPQQGYTAMKRKSCNIIINGFDTTKNMKGKVAQSATYNACKYYFTVVIIVIIVPNP